MRSPSELPSTSGARHVLVGFLAVTYGAFILMIALWPSPINKPVAGLLTRVIEELHQRGIPSFVNYDFIEFSANIVFFLPVGVFFGLALPVRRWMLMLLCGPVLSGLIEIVQREALPDRYASVADVIANSLGATIGVLVALVVRGAVAARDERVIAKHEAQAEAGRSLLSVENS